MGGKSSKPSGTTTVTEKSEPWAEQKPYLTDIFAQAQDLYNNYNPKYYPEATYASPNSYQTLGLQGLANQALYNDQLPGTSEAFTTDLLQGKWLKSNPALGQFQHFAENNFGTTAPGSTVLKNQATRNVADTNPAATALRALQQRGPDTLDGLDTLATLSDLNPSTNSGNALLRKYATNSTPLTGQSTLVNQAQMRADKYGGINDLERFADRAVANPGANAYSSYLSGERLGAGNPYLDAVSNSVRSRVTPQIQSQFIESGTMASPEAARATAEGVSSALAPFAFEQYNTDQSNQLRAADAVTQQALQSRGLQQDAANNFAGRALEAQGLRSRAAETLGNRDLAGRQLRQQGASELADNIMQGYGARADVAGTLAGVSNQSRGLQKDAATSLGNLYAQGSDLSNKAATTLGTQGLAGRELQTKAAEGLNTAHNSALDNMLRGLLTAPQTQQMGYDKWQNLYNAGATNQNLGQAAIDDAIARWNWGQNLPYDKLNYYAGNVTGNYGGTSTRTEPYFINRTGNALSGISGGASLGGSLFGPAGGLIGGGLGLLTSFF